MKPRTRGFAVFAVAAALSAGAAEARVVGERHVLTADGSAALRDAGGGSQVRVTIWYPSADASEKRIDLGPPERPLFEVGAVAPDAAFEDDRQRPAILFSHGFGGTARMMAWFGAALARAGYVVIAVDHPGNNGIDKMTPAGAILHWDRADDLKAALQRVVSDPVIGPHIDRARVGVAGYSAGGFTALVAAGARADPPRLLSFCREHPDDGICRPQIEFGLTLAQAEAAARSPALAGEMSRAGDDRSLPGLRGAFLIAPAIVQELDPASLAAVRVPVSIVLGKADVVAPPDTNGLVAARLLADAHLNALAGVGHYAFLSRCTAAGRAVVPQCRDNPDQDVAHDAAITQAVAFFRLTLGEPPGTQP